MSILNFPDITPAEIEWGNEANTQVFESELNRSDETICLPGDRWFGLITMPTLSGKSEYQRAAHVLKAFLMRLRGPSGRFYLSPPDYTGPNGTAAGTGKVKGAGQVGELLLTDGWTPNQTGLFLPGDYIQAGNELKMIVEPADSDSAGNATLSVMPPFRRSPADNADIITTDPKSIMKLTSDDQARWTAMPGKIYTFPAISIVEAL